MSMIPIQAPMPVGNPGDLPFAQTIEQLLAFYPGSGYGYFSGDSGVFNFQGLGQNGNRTESTIQWVHVVPQESLVPGVQVPSMVANPPQAITPEPATLPLILTLGAVFWMVLLWRKLG